jgi:hypothetical protein
MRLIYAMCVVLLAVRVNAADTAPRQQDGAESLGDQLLDDLSPGLVPVPPTRPADDANEQDSVPNRAAEPVTPRFDDLGKDIGQPSGPLSLIHVRQTMQQAMAYLSESASAGQPPAAERAGAAQQQVVTQLDKLIAELSKQCQCQGGQSPTGNQPKPDQRSQSKPGNKSGSAAGRGRTAARDSTDRLDRASAKPIDKGEINDLVKELWGHLPERSREQMLQSFSDEFLPKYEREIEQYYLRLSEEKSENRP